MGKDPGEIRQQIEHTRAEMGDTFEEVAHRTKVKERAKESVAGTVDSVKGKVSGTASRAESKAKRGGQRLSSMSHENPLGVAIGGVALGFLAGLAVPSSSVEQEKLGPAAEELKGQAKKTGHEAVERGKHIAQEATHRAAETAREQGRQEARELADHARQGGREAASKVGS